MFDGFFGLFFGLLWAFLSLLEYCWSCALLGETQTLRGLCSGPVNNYMYALLIINFVSVCLTWLSNCFKKGDSYQSF